MVNITDEVGNKLSFAEIKQMALDERQNKIFLFVDGREAVILPKKQGKKWWKNASNNDILRVMVF